jgi:Predicted membrane protein (DUF2142)
MARGPLTTRPASGEGEPSAPPEISRATYRRRWLVTFVLLVALATAWSLVTPPGGGPDEPAHAIKAAAVAGGELTGDPYPPVGGGALVVEAPASLDALDPTCFAFQAGISASCRPSYEGPDGDEEIVTTAGVSPPAYYAIVGGPLHLVPSLDGLYLARLIGGIVAAALVATAVQLAAAARSRFLVVAVAVSWTPMAASLTGVVNPSSLELSAGVLVWVSGLLLVRPHPLPPWLERRLIWHFAAASALFVLSRQLSPLLLACIVGAVALAAPLARLRELVADRRTWVAAGVVGVASLFAAWWLVANPVKEDATVAATAVSGRHALSTSFGYFGTLYEQMIGIFGWLDARPPAGVVLSWTVAIGVLVVLGAAVGSRRLVLALVAMMAVSVVLPGLLAASQMDEHGVIFQGRYILPLGAGVVLLAGRAVDETGRDLVDRLSRVVVLVLALTVVAHLVAIWFAARRFAVGVGGPVFFVREGWTPGISLAVPLAVAFVAVPGFAWWCWRTSLAGAPSPVPGAGTTPDEPAEALVAEESEAGAPTGASGATGDRATAGASPAQVGP